MLNRLTALRAKRDELQVCINVISLPDTNTDITACGLPARLHVTLLHITLLRYTLLHDTLLHVTLLYFPLMSGTSGACACRDAGLLQPACSVLMKQQSAGVPNVIAYMQHIS